MHFQLIFFQTGAELRDSGLENIETDIFIGGLQFN